jgi:hypothetical protein
MSEVQRVELLLQPSTGRSLTGRYRTAFARAVELLIVNAYLTDWEDPLS